MSCRPDYSWKPLLVLCCKSCIIHIYLSFYILSIVSLPHSLHFCPLLLSLLHTMICKYILIHVRGKIRHRVLLHSILKALQPLLSETIPPPPHPSKRKYILAFTIAPLRDYTFPTHTHNPIGRKRAENRFMISHPYRIEAHARVEVADGP